MGKKSKRKNVMFNSKNTSSQLLKIKALESNISKAFTFCIEDSETIDNMECINSFLIHDLLFVLSNRTHERSANIIVNNVNHIAEWPIMNNAKVKSLYVKNKVMEARTELSKIIERKFEGSFYRMNCDWMILSYILFMFLEDEEDKEVFHGKKITENLSFKLLDFVYGMELERKIVEECKKTNTICDYSEWKNNMRTYKLNSENLVNNIWSEESREEFCKIYNNYISYWVSEDSEIFAKRNTVESLCVDLDEEVKSKWSKIFELIGKFNYSEKDINKLFSEFAKDIFEKFGYNGYALFSKVCGQSEMYFSKCFESLINDIFFLISEIYNREMIEDKDKVIKANNEEIKELKSSNRSLMKESKNFEKSVEELNTKISNLESELETLQNSTCNNEELLKVQEELNRVKSDLITEKENSVKIKQKSDWKETRINELTSELEKYKTIESDMMILQNENNSLHSQITSLEELEEETGKITFEDKLSKIKNEQILFVGGTGNMLSKFKSMFPNSDYIDISDSGVNFEVPPRFKYIAIYTRVVTHSHCKRIESQVDKCNIIPINICNSKLVVDELYKNIIGHKN